MSATVLDATRQIQWWSSAASGGRAVDVLVNTASLSAMQKEADFVATTFQDCALVVVRVPTVDRSSLANVAAAFRDVQPSPHICLAVHAGALRGCVSGWSTNKRVGLLLDEVDAQTSFSDIASEAIEAFRVTAAFGQRASNHMRSACILDAILGLGHEIGLCTFGSPQRPAHANHRFDFVPSPFDPRNS